MNDRRSQFGDRLDPILATQLVQRWLDPALGVSRVQRLHGGMAHHVYALWIDGDPSSVVLKCNDADRVTSFEHEADALRYLHEHTDLPVVESLAVIRPESDQPLSGLILPRIEAVNLADARLSPRGVAVFQEQLAHHLTRLHARTAKGFGSAMDERRPTRWLEVFGPIIQQAFDRVEDQLASRARHIIAAQLAHLDRWLDHEASPGLIHGDLWATNILVDDRHPDRPRICAFIDPAPTFADPEYELAYVHLLKTANDPFFRAYAKQNPLRQGFERRCRIYWLNTLLMHVHHFGRRYVGACEDLADQLSRLR